MIFSHVASASIDMFELVFCITSSVIVGRTVDYLRTTIEVHTGKNFFAVTDQIIQSLNVIALIYS